MDRDHPPRVIDRSHALGPDDAERLGFERPVVESLIIRLARMKARLYVADLERFDLVCNVTGATDLPETVRVILELFAEIIAPAISDDGYAVMIRRK